MGFEPTCPVKDNCISSAARYDRFDNSPCHICNISLKKTSGKRRELMERTKVISVVNNTAKAPKNQGFLEKCFRSGHSFSSAARYDRFDNSPCHICNISFKKTSGKRRELMERTKVISVVNNTAKMTASIRLRFPADIHPPPLFYSILTFFARA